MLWDRYCLIAAVHCIVGWILSDSNSSLHCGINIVSQLQFIALRDKYCLTAAVHYIASYLIIGVNGFFLHSSRDGSPLNAPAHPLLSPLLHRDPPEDPLNHLRPLSERPHQVSSGHSVWFLLYLVHITVSLRWLSFLGIMSSIVISALQSILDIIILKFSSEVKIKINPQMRRSRIQGATLAVS